MPDTRKNLDAAEHSQVEQERDTRVPDREFTRRHEKVENELSITDHTEKTKQQRD